MERYALKSAVDECLSRKGVAVVDISKKYKSRVLDYHRELGVDPKTPLGNMSMCRLADGNLLVSVRQFHYNKKPRVAALMSFDASTSRRANHIIVTDRNFGFIDKISHMPLPMYEDIRLMRYGDIIQASATDISSGCPKMCCMTFKLNDRELVLADTIAFPERKQKNYIPVEDGMGVFVSDMGHGSLDIVTTYRPDRKTRQPCRGCAPYRGSTPMLRWQDGYVALVHRHSGHRYMNAFAFFDKALKQCRLSQEFSVLSNISTVNFCCGMLLEGDKAVLPICIHDCIAYLFEIPLRDFYRTARQHY